MKFLILLAVIFVGPELLLVTIWGVAIIIGTITGAWKK